MGAVAGTAGGATGAVTGGVIGAIVGAAVGGGTGATAGATTGAAGGGAAGYYGYKHKDEIKAKATTVTAKAKEWYDYVMLKGKETAETVSAGYASVSGKINTAIGRGGSTG